MSTCAHGCIQPVALTAACFVLPHCVRAAPSDGGAVIGRDRSSFCPLRRPDDRDKRARLVMRVVQTEKVSVPAAATAGCTMETGPDSKANTAKENRRGVYFVHLWLYCSFTNGAKTSGLSSAVVIKCVCGSNWRHVCFLPPDKGTVQKVIVLPSNNSLHEDLILEELEVFKVSCLSFSSVLFLLSSLFSPKIKGREEEEEEEGELGHSTQWAGPSDNKGWHSADACFFLQCSAAPSRRLIATPPVLSPLRLSSV